MKNYLIFTDLDGTLLNHENYSLGNNRIVINKILKKSNQIIINSSKTFIEVSKIVKELNLSLMPFSTENGAMVFFPKKIFKKPHKAISGNKYWKIRLARLSSQSWHHYLRKKKQTYLFDIVQDLSLKNIKSLTNLKDIKPMLSRMASQLIIWRDNYNNFKKFRKEVKDEMDGDLNKGGRFIQISSSCNKRISLNLISHTYFDQFHDKYSKTIIALGDSMNDKEMLNYVKYPCIIKNISNVMPILNKNKKNIFWSKSIAPKGWEEALISMNNSFYKEIY